MVFQAPRFWDITGDGFQILLYLLMLCYFIKYRANQRKLTIKKTQSGIGQSFNTHFFGVTLEQQVNQAFANIIETITAERDGLESVLGLNPPNYDDDDIPILQSNTHLSNSHGNHRLSNGGIERAERHDKVRKFAAQGLNARKISNELKIPLSEVELILSLSEE